MPLAASGIRAFGKTPLDGDRLGGDLLLVLFWGTWNQRSIAQVEMLDAMAESLRESGISSLAVAVQEPARTFVRSTGRTMFSRFLEDHPVKILLARAELETIDRLELVGLPTTFLIDAGGRLLARCLGDAVARRDRRRAGAPPDCQQTTVGSAGRPTSGGRPVDAVASNLFIRVPLLSVNKAGGSRYPFRDAPGR